MTVTEEHIRNWLEEVSDPEIPVLSVMDMGIVRNIRMEGKRVEVDITPTYSGCPAMDMIAANIRERLEKEGLETVEVKEVLSPAWTTAWLTQAGREKLEAYGIAPPVEGTADKRTLFGKSPEVRCPQCGSMNTEMVSAFGSTACKSLYRCKDCQEPFDYFKCI